MSKTVFISFAHDDAAHMHVLKSSASGEFVDRTSAGSVQDASGNKLDIPPHHPDSEGIRAELTRMLESANKMVILVGKHTNSSLWVSWEVQEFARLRGKDNIIAMRVDGDSTGQLPKVAKDMGISPIDWNPGAV